VELVGLPEAAQRLGVSVDTIKRRLRRGELKGQQEPRPQGYTWLIEIPESEPTSMAGSNASSTADLDSATVEIVNLRAMLEMAQAQIGAQQDELTSKNEQIRELHVLLQQAQPALSAPRGGWSWWRFWQR